MKILSFDPGKVNSFAYALLEDGKCLRTGILWSIEDLTPDLFEKNYIKFAQQIEDLIKDCHLKDGDHIVLERYITRPGMGMGNNSEFINIMIGILVMVARPLPVCAIPPSQWKNYLRKSYSIGKETAKKPRAPEASDSSKRKTKRAVRPSAPCRYENVLAMLQERYPETTMLGAKKAWVKVHEADALGIGVYWWEHLTEQRILDSVWSAMRAKQNLQVG